MAQPFTFEEPGNMLTAFVIDSNKFWPSGGFVDNCECLIFSTVVLPRTKEELY
jgi:hypothetical protein